MKTRTRTVLLGAGFFGFIAITALLVTSSLNSCSTLQQLAGLTRMQFKLQDAQHISLAGIDLTNKRSIRDFGVMDGISAVQAFSTGRFPLTLTLNVAAKNPNAATGDKSLSVLQLTQFPWRLILNGKETVSGGIGAPISIPSGGVTQIIPLQMSVDLKQFFADKGYDELLNLALAISGNGVSQLQLKAQPTVQTPVMTLQYPNELTIVSTEFRN